MSQASGALIAPRLVTASGSLPLRGHDLGMHTIEDAAIAWEDGVLTYVGPAAGSPSAGAEVLADGVVAPGFVDCHTHLPFVGWRADEYAARLAGRSYRDLHGEGGGIGRSARLLAAASDDEVIEFSLSLAREMAEHGTTSLELKTGYGLSVEAELRQARLARRLAVEAPQTCTITLLCHAVPEGWNRADWVRAFVDKVVPAAAAEGLADQVDIYVEDIAFDLDDLGAIAAGAAAAGLPLRCHADQLGWMGAAEAAAALGARGVDHVNQIGEAGVAALGAATGSVAVLLPASTFCMGAAPPPVGALVEAGAALALATDCNPGTSPVVSIPEAVAMGARLYGLAPDAALAAATANAAWVLGLHEQTGTLEAGKRADFLVLDGEGPDHVAYRPGHNPVRRTYAGGTLVGGRAAGPLL